MKKISIALMIIAVFLAGCVSFEVENTEKEIAAKIAARHVGFELQKKYPDIAVEVLALSEELLVVEGSEFIKVIFDRVVFVLTSEVIDDKLLIMDIQDIVGLIKIKSGVEITSEQIKLIKIIAEGLIQGIEG